MDGYAPAYVAHNIPLLIVSGLKTAAEKEEKSAGTRITSDIPPVETEDAATLLRHFRDGDASNLPWNSREHLGRNKFRVKTVGRVFRPSQDLLSSTEAQ